MTIWAEMVRGLADLACPRATEAATALSPRWSCSASPWLAHTCLETLKRLIDLVDSTFLTGLAGGEARTVPGCRPVPGEQYAGSPRDQSFASHLSFRSCGARYYWVPGWTRVPRTRYAGVGA
jgi:hypothetical protein